jgi:hypothetical protein
VISIVILERFRPLSFIHKNNHPSSLAILSQ